MIKAIKSKERIMRQNTKVWVVSLSLVAAMALVALGVGVNQVWAQGGSSNTTDSSASTTITDTTTVSNTAKAPMPNPVRQAGLEAAAKLLGMSASDLSDQLWGGKTLADLAKDANVKLSDLRTAVQDAMKTARQTQLKAAIDKALAAGRITQDHADWLKQGIDNGWLGNGQMMAGMGMDMGMGMNGFGNFGNGMGMGRGMRGQNRMNNQNKNQSQGQSDSNSGSGN